MDFDSLLLIAAGVVALAVLVVVVFWLTREGDGHG
jgi:hypothetical protein